MSDKERPRADDGGGGRSGGADDEDGEGPTDREDPKEKKCKRCGKKGKRVSLFRLRKGQKVVPQKRKQKGISTNSGCWGRSGGGGGGRGGAGGGGGGGGGCGWCCLCLKQPRNLDSPGESPPSDPNSSEFTFDMLRALIEKNDFYSKECNPHLDADD